MKKKSLLMATCVALVLVLGLVGGVWADNPDDVSFSGFSATVNGSDVGVQVTTSGGAQTVALPYASGAVGTVAPGDSITVTFSVGASGAHTAPTYPRTVGLAAVTHSAPTGGPDVTVGGLTSNGTLTKSGTGTTTDPYVVSTFQRTATFTAPSGNDGAYTLKITGTDQASSGQKLNPRFFYITFTVLTSETCTPAATTLTLGTPDCVILHATSVSLSATLTVTSDSTPLVGKTITFYVDDASVGTGVTDGDGRATFDYNPSALGVGNHSLSADWQSDDECYQNSTALGGTLGVKYFFVGFQPPIKADGSTILTGKCGPVKIVITDVNGMPVPDATAYVYFADGIQAIVGTDPENVATGLNFDYGNLMRYSDGQYVYNWDLSTTTNGTKTIQVYLGEGSCADAHTVVVSVGKKGK